MAAAAVFIVIAMIVGIVVIGLFGRRTKAILLETINR